MPLSGVGIAPPAGAEFNQYNALVRRGFVPYVTQQLYQSQPVLSGFLSGAKRASGGLSPITVPIQTSSMTTFDWSGYDASFTRTPPPIGVQNAEFNIKLGIAPVVVLGTEAAITAEHAVVPIIKVRMHDVMDVVKTALGQAIVNNDYTTGIYGGANKDQIIGGLPMAFDAGASAVPYGGITRASGVAPNWEGQRETGAIAINTNGRAALATQIVRTSLYAGGQMPSVGFLSAQDWTQLAKDFIGTESRQIIPGSSFDDSNAGFTSLSICGVPFFFDPNIPKGTGFAVNNRYCAIHIHNELAFAWSGFYSMIPLGQVGFVGVLLFGAEFVCTKPKANLWMSNITGGDSF